MYQGVALSKNYLFHTPVINKQVIFSVHLWVNESPIYFLFFHPSLCLHASLCMLGYLLVAVKTVRLIGSVFADLSSLYYLTSLIS